MPPRPRHCGDVHPDDDKIKRMLDESNAKGQQQARDPRTHELAARYMPTAQRHIDNGDNMSAMLTLQDMMMDAEALGLDHGVVTVPEVFNAFLALHDFSEQHVDLLSRRARAHRAALKQRH